MGKFFCVGIKIIFKPKLSTCADEQQSRVHPKDCSVCELQREVIYNVVF